MRRNRSGRRILFYRVDPLPAFIPANVPGLLVLLLFVGLGLLIGNYVGPTLLGRLALIGFATTLLSFFAVGYRWSESYWT